MRPLDLWKGMERNAMNAQIKLGRVFGIEIGLHYSWIIIALLIAFSLAGNFAQVNPNWSQGTIWSAAIITAILFFFSIVLHELAHSLVAKSRGLPVRSITLFALGGVSQIEKESADPKTEFWMGIVGPITSLVIGFICLAIAAALGWTVNVSQPTPVLAVLGWLGYINITLGVFNLIPGFPLDGGRVLRAIIWWVTGKADKSTKIAATVGHFVALAFIVFGLLRFFGGAGFGGLWLAFIGWFLLDAARASVAQAELTSTLRGVRVRDVMNRNYLSVDGNTNLQTFVDQMLLPTGERCFLVEQSGEVIGLVTPHEVKAVERNKWPYTTVVDVMRPLSRLHVVSPDSPITDALETMGRDDVNQLPVIKNGHLEGLISRGQVLRFLQTRAELHM